MYVQITTKCNMRCRHCGYSCTREGEDMSIKVFRQIVQQEDEALGIGGGEPTIHSRFWEFLALALAHTDTPWLATNGKRTESALALAKMAQRGIIGCALSQDRYHDPIDDEVVKAFAKAPVNGCYQSTACEFDRREIRDVTGLEANSGRCDFGGDECLCEDTFVKPNGVVYQCGCLDSPVIGSIQEGYESNECGTCHRDLVGVPENL